MVWVIALLFDLQPLLQQPDVRPVVGDSGPKTEAPTRREVIAPRAPTPQTVTLPDEVVVRAVQAAQPSFARCFKRAMQTDAYDAPFKVTLHLEVDDTGKITGGRTDAASRTLNNCLLRVGFGLELGAPGHAAVVDVPLFFNG